MATISALGISASALSANKTKMDVISQNIANAETIQTDSEQAYKRRIATIGKDTSFRNFLDSEQAEIGINGVKITSITEDNSPFKMVYDPDNPYANEEGYVMKSNVDVTQEMLDLLTVSRAYEANLTALNATKDMLVKSLKIAD